VGLVLFAALTFLYFAGITVLRGRSSDREVADECS